ncbi:hypothetical protein CER19_23985 [Pseudomonas sp. GL93]|nr:hypothetical protein CER19_23985 [Pseudomonas sp. GL93]
MPIYLINKNKELALFFGVVGLQFAMMAYGGSAICTMAIEALVAEGGFECVRKDRPTFKMPTDDMTKPASAVKMHAVCRWPFWISVWHLSQ